MKNLEPHDNKYRPICIRKYKGEESYEKENLSFIDLHDGDIFIIYGLFKKIIYGNA